MPDTRMQVLEVLRETKRNIDLGNFDMSKPLLGELLDSLDFAIFLMSLEDRFSVSFAKIRAQDLATLEKLVQAINAQLAQPGK